MCANASAVASEAEDPIAVFVASGLPLPATILRELDLRHESRDILRSEPVRQRRSMEVGLCANSAVVHAVATQIAMALMKMAATAENSLNTSKSTSRPRVAAALSSSQASQSQCVCPRRMLQEQKHRPVESMMSRHL
jgi:hypothetical protein